MENTSVVELLIYGVIVLGSSTGVAFITPPKIAKAVNVLGWVLKGAKVLVDAASGAIKKIEDSKGGLSTELAVEQLKETSKEIAIKEIKKVVDPNNKLEMITEKDFVEIGNEMLNSKGMIGSASKVKRFFEGL